MNRDAPRRQRHHGEGLRSDRHPDAETLSVLHRNTMGLERGGDPFASLAIPASRQIEQFLRGKFLKLTTWAVIAGTGVVLIRFA